LDDNGLTAYVGDPDIHDGYIRAVVYDKQKVNVTVEAHNGQWLVIQFDNVAWVKSLHPEGMMLYALAEGQCKANIRRFVFINWDEEDDAFLEIGAIGFEIIKQGNLLSATSS
jgi:hypothetical protein